MASPRANRVPERIKEILAELIGTAKDPRIGFVTVTDVRTTADHAHATVYYTVLGSPDDRPPSDRHPGPAAPPHARQPKGSSDEASDRSVDAVIDDADVQTSAQERTAEGLASATPMLRRELGRRLRLRHVPTLTFVHDPVPEQGRRIEALIDEARGRR